MLNRPDTQVLRAMQGLSPQADWITVRRFLQDELTKLHHTLESCLDEAKLRQLQGRAQFVREFLDLVENSRQTLEKLRESSL